MATDPLEVLRLPATPIAPRPGFTRDLRRRLALALAPSTTAEAPTTTEGTTMTTATETTTPGTPAPATAVRPITPYICTRGAADAIDFYRVAFGAVEQMRMTGDDGRVGHAELSIGGAMLMLSDEHPEIGVVSPATLGGTPMTLHLDVDDVDAVYARSLAAGATGERGPADQFHGHRTATVLDPFGHRWTLTSVIEELSVEDLARRAPEYTTTAGDPGTAGEPGLAPPR